jgi:transketolase
MPDTPKTVAIDQLCVNTIRMLSADAVQKANSGHPGLPMGAAPMAYALWTRFLRFNPVNPGWPGRDRFVLSAGHGSMLLYSLLHLSGYDLSLQEIKQFRQWGSSTPGHPEFGETPGVETTTGPLGQGFGNAVGMALAEARLAAEFNRPGHEIVDHYTYVLASDGDMMEGVQSEAASLAGHLRLHKLVVLYDDNHVTIEGHTPLTFSEDVKARFEAYRWDVQEVGDGNDIEAVTAAIERARRQLERPSLIAVRTQIGYGSPHKQDTSSAHGEPLGEEELALTKANLGWPLEPSFLVPAEVSERFAELAERGSREEKEWSDRLLAYGEAEPALAAEWQRRMSADLPPDWAHSLPVFSPSDGKLATRAASGKVLNAVAARLPELIGGSADLAPSNKTLVADSGDFGADAYDQRNLHFGIREHAMGSLMNGMALHGGLIPYGGTFLVFADYMRPAVRLAALMGLRVIYVYTHDSIAVGEDGPTHEPVEQVASLRLIPNLTVIRPADANEVREAWRLAIERTDGPVALILTRQGLPILDRSAPGLAGAEMMRRGGYVLASEPDGSEPDLILIASGSEVHLALGARERLISDGVACRVVNLASWRMFEEQDEAYRLGVLPPSVTARLAVEAGTTFGWERYTGSAGDVLGIDRFGASAPGPVNLEKFGFTVDEVERRARALL